MNNKKGWMVVVVLVAVCEQPSCRLTALLVLQLVDDGDGCGCGVGGGRWWWCGGVVGCDRWCCGGSGRWWCGRWWCGGVVGCDRWCCGGSGRWWCGRWRCGGGGVAVAVAWQSCSTKMKACDAHATNAMTTPTTAPMPSWWVQVVVCWCRCWCWCWCWCLVLVYVSFARELSQHELSRC